MRLNFMRFISITALTALLMGSQTGCLLAGVAGATGAIVGNREYNKAEEKKRNAIEKEAVREARAEWEDEQNRRLSGDERLVAAINSTYIGGSLSKVLAIHTIVEDGVVILFGNVPDKKVADRAVDIASRMPGVRRVVSNLVVIPVKLVPQGKVSFPPAPSRDHPPQFIIKKSDMPSELPIERDSNSGESEQGDVQQGDRGRYVPTNGSH